MKGSRQAGRRSPSPAVLKFGFMQGQAPRSFATHANRPAPRGDVARVIAISDRYCEDFFRRVWEMKGPGKKKIRGLGFLILDIIFRENWKVILSDRFCETILIL